MSTVRVLRTQTAGASMASQGVVAHDVSVDELVEDSRQKRSSRPFPRTAMPLETPLSDASPKTTQDRCRRLLGGFLPGFPRLARRSLSPRGGYQPVTRRDVAARSPPDSNGSP